MYLLDNIYTGVSLLVKKWYILSKYTNDIIEIIYTKVFYLIHTTLRGLMSRMSIINIGNTPYKSKVLSFNKIYYTSSYNKYL